MLDPDTGELVLQSSGLRLGPAWSRTTFLGSSLATRTEPLTINEPWARYGLELPAGEVAPFPVYVALQFDGPTLVWLSITNVNPEFGTGWDDWSEAKELARREAHDRWLAASGVRPGSYPWAQVESVYDPKSAVSSIWIRYDQRTLA